MNARPAFTGPPPVYGPRELVEALEGAMERAGFAVFRRPHDLTLGAIRSASREAGRFDDVLYALVTDDHGRRHLRLWPGTVDAGIHYRRHPLSPRGTLVLPAGQHRGLWKVGVHKAGETGAHPAFVQAREVTVTRDDDRDAVIDLDGPEHTDWFGLNGHGASPDGAERVGRSSAGCVVWRYRDDLGAALALAEAQDRHGLGDTVSLAVLDEVPTLGPVMAACGVGWRGGVTPQS